MLLKIALGGAFGKSTAALLERRVGDAKRAKRGGQSPPRKESFNEIDGAERKFPGQNPSLNLTKTNCTARHMEMMERRKRDQARREILGKDYKKRIP